MGRGFGGGAGEVASSPLPPHPLPTPPLLPPYCVGRTRRAKPILACMESCKGTSAPDLLITSLEESKVYDRV